jgi:hypothetical protein
MTMQIKRGNRASLNALASANSLVVGQPILITDEARIAVSTAPNAYSAMAKQSEIGGGAAFAMTTVEINLGYPARRSGKFAITGAGMTIGKPVLIQQAAGPYTGKGSLADEAEMDAIEVSASVTSATTITGYWKSRTRVGGKIKFNYVIGA